MGKNKIMALAFLVSGLFMTVCCFLPIKTIALENTLLGMENEVIKFMPSLGGFIVLGLSVACVVFPIVGYKQQSAIVGTITALVAGGLLWYLSSSAIGLAKNASGLGTLMGETFGDATGADPVITTNVGFYLIIIAMVMVLISGFGYTLSDDD